MLIEFNDEELLAKIKELIPLGETMKVSKIAQKLHVKSDEITDVIPGNQFGLDLIVGIRCGAGYADLNKSDWEIEHYE